jgi:dienelactone hydrolase
MRIWWCAMALMLAGTAEARVVVEDVTVPVTITRPGQDPLRHDLPVSIFRETSRPRAPFLVLGHGRAATAEERAAMGRARYTPNSQYFVSLGFVVLVPTRIGYGIAGGPDLEDAGACAHKAYEPGFAAAAQQTRAVIDHARRLPYVERDGGLVVGQSFGGTTAITMAATDPGALRAAVNFAGGGGGRPQTHPAQPCRPDLLRAMFQDYGRTARLPTLWLYAANDRYFGPRFPREWFDAFVAAGGQGRFIALPAHGDDGHPSFTRNPDAWRPAFEAFLREVGYAIPQLPR